jgi:hypothetical protein
MTVNRYESTEETPFTFYVNDPFYNLTTYYYPYVSQLIANQADKKKKKKN